MRHSFRSVIAGLSALVLLSSSMNASAERAFDLLKRRDFRSAYHGVLGKFKSERWIAELPGPSTEGSKVSADGIELVLADSCKPHDCSDENLIIAYAPERSKIYVLLKTRGKSYVLGGPSSAIKAVLETAYKDRFGP